MFVDAMSPAPYALPVRSATSDSSAQVEVFARDNCERGSLDRRVPHHIRRATPLLAVDFEILALPHPEEGPRHRNDLSLRKPVAWSSNPTGGTSRETIPAAARAKLTQTILPARFFFEETFFR